MIRLKLFKLLILSNMQFKIHKWQKSKKSCKYSQLYFTLYINEGKKLFIWTKIRKKSEMYF